MFKKIIILYVLAALSLAACGAPAALPEPSKLSYESDGYSTGGSGASALELAVFATQTVSDATVGTRAEEQRLVIKNANLSLVVKNPEEALAAIAQLAEGMGGFVVTSNSYQTSTDAAGNKIMQGAISIRVPAARLTEALTQIKSLAVTVNSENISGEDVTAQYTDLESQLRNLEAAEAQLQKIMESATKTEDVLNVYNQLVSVRGQIEVVKGQMKYYSEAAAMSFIGIDLFPDALSQPLVVAGWHPEGVAKEAVEALIETMQGLATVLIWAAIYLLPLVLLFGLPLFGGVWWLRRKMRSAKAPKA